VKALVCARHPILRHGIAAALISAHPGSTIVQSGSWPETLECLDTNKPALLVIELELLHLDHLDDLRDARLNHPDLKIITLSDLDDRSIILRCLAAGVHGYILKTSGIEEIISGLQSVLAGTLHVPPILATVAESRSAEVRPQPPIPTLSARKQQVLRLAAQGSSTKQIARTLGLGVGTVKTHLAAIYRALGARNRLEALAKMRERETTSIFSRTPASDQLNTIAVQRHVVPNGHDSRGTAVGLIAAQIATGAAKATLVPEELVN
jgi:DNA-binding NarL/FixJ family response regulator